MNIGDLVKFKNTSFFVTRAHNQCVGVIVEKKGADLCKVKWNIPEERFQQMWHNVSCLEIVTE